MNFKKIPSEDKNQLNPEAKRWDSIILPNGHVYRCIDSSDEFSFAWWERVTPWRKPLHYWAIRLAWRNRK